MSLLKIALFISDTLLFATPLLFTALGGMFTEKAGVTNIGLEGMMTIGAFAGAAVGYFTKSALLGFLAGGVAASLVALIHAVVSITFGADQVVSGIAINFIGPGVSLFICSLLFDGAKQTIPVAEGEGKMIKIFDNLTGVDFIDKILGQYVTTYVALGLVILISIYLYKTKFGLRLIAVGEHPKAAETLNVNVYLYRYFAVIISGLLAGFGGATMSLATVSNFSQSLVSGHGFIALVAVIFGKWKPYGVLGACLFFGAAQELAILLPSLNINIPESILPMVPYISTLLVLIFFVGKSKGPSSAGVPYIKLED
ncbi:ABC transporter permease [Parvimonas micra]|uniref:Branched-chain amino acid ABC transporter, permease protein n=1 Tax=Parvimonas micra ATCC 33270 TaxID=411465 RepID=A8SN23_9FIRM|nr:ABC transporter permease [Parvimonas micra]EDP23717.1 branched-chain amino acid ABC transporter, permease protein [Parvimonas micra ATCC 33270]MCK6129851.1 ABC transporter permease [Parvimonas micra]MCK6135497.1 ABC transporter permease [Parvimonas micra]MCK6136969.1 ABC transporter permease [Parvimonas micra]MCK6153496.1 ABC transporter permease [Parvimonas micra]